MPQAHSASAEAALAQIGEAGRLGLPVRAARRCIWALGAWAVGHPTGLPWTQGPSWRQLSGLSPPLPPHMLTTGRRPAPGAPDDSEPPDPSRQHRGSEGERVSKQAGAHLGHRAQTLARAVERGTGGGEAEQKAGSGSPSREPQAAPGPPRAAAPRRHPPDPSPRSHLPPPPTATRASCSHSSFLEQDGQTQLPGCGLSETITQASPGNTVKFHGSAFKIFFFFFFNFLAPRPPRTPSLITPARQSGDCQQVSNTCQPRGGNNNKLLKGCGSVLTARPYLLGGNRAPRPGTGRPPPPTGRAAHGAAGCLCVPSAATRPGFLRTRTSAPTAKPGAPLPLLRPTGLLHLGPKGCRRRSHRAPRRGGETGALSPPAAARAAADPSGATRGPARPGPTPRASAASPTRPPRARPPRGARPRRRLRSKWIWRRRAAGYETRGRHMAAPAPNLAGPAEPRRPGEAGPGARRPRRHSPTDR